MERLNPKNREQAFAFQFEDDVKLLKSLSSVQGTDNTAFKQALITLKSHISVYEDPKLIKEKKKQEWVCNECNTPNFTQSIPRYEIEQEQHACINCGCFEFHLK